MFISMIDDTQAPRDANAPGGFGGADNTARSEGTATDGAQVKIPRPASFKVAAP